MPKDRQGNVMSPGGQYELMEGAGRPPTLERRAFVAGLFEELQDQLSRHVQRVAEVARLQARLSLSERNLRATRDHLQAVLSQTDEEVPADWQLVLQKVRFVGARLGDACIEILREHSQLTTQDLLDELNKGQFRFRTGTPLREINAAMLRQPNVKRKGDSWIYERLGTPNRTAAAKEREGVA